MSENSDVALHAIPASSIKPSQPKSTILKKGKPKPKKGLGAKKKGGLGAQKVNEINFNELEKDAEVADKARTRLSISSSHSDKSGGGSEDASVTSIRLAYKDLEIQKKQTDKMFSAMDDRKQQQASRLGMGMGKTGGVSHGLSMKTIDQVDPIESKGHYRDNDNDIFYDAPSRSKRSNWSKWNDVSSDEDDMIDSKFDKSRSKKPPPSYTITPITDGHRADTTMFNQNSTKDKDSNERLRKPTSRQPIDNSLDKYREKTSVSSDMFPQSKEEEYQERLRNLQGRTAISSDDLYGSQSGQSESSFRGGVREGVRSVAGKLSNIASDIAGSIQDRYGY